MSAYRKSLSQRLLHLNWSLIVLISFISCIGFAMLYSAADGHLNPWASKQIIRFCLFFPIFISIALIDIRIWLRYAYVIYAGCLCALMVVEFFGTTAMGGDILSTRIDLKKLIPCFVGFFIRRLHCFSTS